MLMVLHYITPNMFGRRPCNSTLTCCARQCLHHDGNGSSQSIHAELDSEHNRNTGYSWQLLALSSLTYDTHTPESDCVPEQFRSILYYIWQLRCARGSSNPVQDRARMRRGQRRTELHYALGYGRRF